MLRLPSEIRNFIYSYALDTAFVQHEADFSIPRRGLCLPQTCRQINNETLPFLETYSTLCLPTYSLMYLESLQWTLNGRSFKAVKDLWLKAGGLSECRMMIHGWTEEQNFGLYLWKIARMFLSLECLALPLDLDDLGKPYLELEYRRFPDWWPEDLRY